MTWPRGPGFQYWNKNLRLRVAPPTEISKQYRYEIIVYHFLSFSSKTFEGQIENNAMRWIEPPVEIRPTPCPSFRYSLLLFVQ